MTQLGTGQAFLKALESFFFRTRVLIVIVYMRRLKGLLITLPL